MTRRFEEGDPRGRTQPLDGETSDFEQDDGGGARIYDDRLQPPTRRHDRPAPVVRRRAPDERIRELILALGDPNHPEHAHAIAELVTIGPPAVSALSAALSPDRPWLTSYRAAEAIAQIGDGRASGALIGALRHPNSNVRWSAVRALAEVGDTRTLLALRRVAHEDRGKTSWGESVADTAQFALDRLQGRSALLRFSEPIKTAVVFVAMFAALLFAADRVQLLRDELRRPVSAPEVAAAPSSEDTAEAGETDAEASLTPTQDPFATPTSTISTATVPTTSAGSSGGTSASRAITSTVRAGSGNVRSEPRLGDNVIGIVNQGDVLNFIGISGDWYLVELGENVSTRSSIRGGQGWVSRIVVNEPSRQPPQATPTR